MKKHYKKIGLVGVVLAFTLVSGSAVFALPSEAQAHAQSTVGPGYSSTNNPAVSKAPSGKTNGQAHLQAAQLKACQNRQNAINNIMVRIDTRAQNQLNLFASIATRVENFYTKQGKTLSNYNQLLSAVNTAKTQAEADFGTMKTNSSFSCTSSSPKGMVVLFQGTLKTEITDLQNFRTAVKNLIVGVASANGVTVSQSNHSSSSQGVQ